MSKVKLTIEVWLVRIIVPGGGGRSDVFGVYRSQDAAEERKRVMLEVFERYSSVFHGCRVEIERWEARS